MNCCANPFSFLEVQPDGIIYPCCPSWCKQYSFGSIFENDFDKVWNSERAVDFRKKVIDGSYSFCDKNICEYEDINELSQKNMEGYAEYPKGVKFAHDKTCNYQCITCRDGAHTLDSNYNDFLDSKIDSVFLPMLKNAEEVFFSGNGDPFVSRHYKKLIKAIVKTYPNMKFSIHTNGSLCNYENCLELGLIGKINKVWVSMHAMSENTYKLITKNGDFEAVMKNLKWLSELKKKGEISELQLNFVVHKLNYKEMPGFVKIAENLDAIASFWEFRDWQTEYARHYNDVAIFEPNHPEHDKFLSIITQEIFQSPNCKLNPLLKILSDI